MRLLTLAAAAVLLIGTALAYFTYFGLREAHIAALVPSDFRFGLFYSSANDLVELYEGPYQRRNFRPAIARIGARINVPGLNGVNYGAPVGSFFTRDKKELLLVPYNDFGSFSDAFDKARENLRLKDPRRPASNYLSLSISSDRAERGDDNPLIVEAVEYPMALAGHPESGSILRLMLKYLLAFDAERKLPGVPLLSEEIGRIPDPVADFVAVECQDLLLGLRKPKEDGLSGLIEIAATLAPQSVLKAAAPIAGEVDLTDLLASFPRDTRILGGAVLDRSGWQRIGLPIRMGDGAFAFGIVVKQYHSRRFNLLLAAHPAQAADLTALQQSGFRLFAAQPHFSSVADRETEVHTAKLERWPAWLETLLRSHARKQPPPVYLTTAAERGTWLCAVGSQAEGIVRTALGCLRGARELSVFGLKIDAHGGPQSKVSPLQGLSGGHALVAMLTAEGMRAFQYPMPYFDLAAIGQPSSATLVLDVVGVSGVPGVSQKARGTLRLAR